MHHFPHHIGDYAAATAHLSWDEDLAYTRLLRAYYQHEKPIPADLAQACRLARCATPAQRRAVEAVLREFFELREDGWHQKRCDAEIAQYQEIVEKNRENGRKGGRRVGARARAYVPRETLADGNPVGTQWVSDGFDLANRPGTQPVSDGFDLAKRTLTQTKANQNQEPEPEPEPPTALGTADAVPVPDAGTPDCPHAEIIAAYHELLPELRAVASWSEQRQGYLRARWREDPQRQCVAWWREFFAYVRKCPLLMGRKPGADWEADLEWLVRPNNFVKVIEGKYEERAA